MYSVDFFESEIELIKDKGIKGLVYKAFDKAPEYFWSAPASSTGKYHPPDSNGEGGLCRHSLKVCWLDMCFVRAFERPDDIHRAASMLHDITKFGVGDKMESGRNRPQYQNHAEIGGKWLWELYDFTDNNPETITLRNNWAVVCNCVLSHMGRWGKFPPLTIDQQILHLADMASAEKRIVGLEFMGLETNSSNTGTNTQESSNGEKKYFFEREDGKQGWNIGKYYGRTPIEILLVNPGYLDWIKKEGFPQEVIDVFEGVKKESAGSIPNLEDI